ncbi:MAG: hypothetical protein JRL30_25700 [Deltaproteobacteria bacterium]|nr:hypothetical protein [Deltaproteobacteria bacterium]
MALVLNGTPAFTDAALNSGAGATFATICDWTATRDSLIHLHVQLGDTAGDTLDTAGATLTLKYGTNRGGAIKIYNIGSPETIDSTGFVNSTVVHFPAKQPLFVESGETLRVLASSSNNNDTQIDGYVWVIDHYAAKGYTASDYVQVDVYSVGDDTPVDKDLVEKDARLRVNKAIQNKATGTITVRNDADDGDLYIITLTDNGTTITSVVADA